MKKKRNESKSLQEKRKSLCLYQVGDVNSE